MIGECFDNTGFSAVILIKSRVEFELKQKEKRDRKKKCFAAQIQLLHQAARKPTKSERERERKLEIERCSRRNKRGKAVPVCKCVIKRRVGRVERYRETARGRQGQTRERETKTDRRT